MTTKKEKHPTEIEPEETLFRMTLEVEPEDVREIEPEASAGVVLPALPDERALTVRTQQLVERALTFTITTAQEFQAAGFLLQELKDHDRLIEEWTAPEIKKRHDHWKEATDKRRLMLTPVQRAITALGSGYTSFDRLERQKAQELKWKLEREEQEKERARLKAEADERAAHAAKLHEEAMQAKSGTEAQMYQAQADELEAEATDLTLAAASVERPVAHVVSASERVEGMPGVKKNWTWELEDKDMVILAAANWIRAHRPGLKVTGETSPMALEVDSTYLNKRAKADEGTALIPGVRFWDKGSVASARRKKP